MVWENSPDGKTNAMVMVFIMFFILLLPWYHSGSVSFRYDFIYFLVFCMLATFDAGNSVPERTFLLWGKEPCNNTLGCSRDSMTFHTLEFFCPYHMQATSCGVWTNWIMLMCLCDVQHHNKFLGHPTENVWSDYLSLMMFCSNKHHFYIDLVLPSLEHSPHSIWYFVLTKSVLLLSCMLELYQY